jgi:hypothetical protein
MKTILKLVVVGGIVFAAGISLAVGSESLTKDEKVLTMAARPEMFERLHNASIRKASIYGQKAVVPNLVLQVADEKGAAIPDGNLPPALANLEADLRNTDILGELRNAAFESIRKPARPLTSPFSWSACQRRLSPSFGPGSSTSSVVLSVRP